MCDVCAYMCHIYRVNGINHVTSTIVEAIYKLHFMLLTNIIEQICCNIANIDHTILILSKYIYATLMHSYY